MRAYEIRYEAMDESKFVELTDDDADSTETHDHTDKQLSKNDALGHLETTYMTKQPFNQIACRGRKSFRKLEWVLSCFCHILQRLTAIN